MSQSDDVTGFAEYGDDFEIPVVTVAASSPFERGVQHGSLATAQIDASIEYYATLFSLNHSLDWAEVSQRSMSWEKPIGDFDPDLLAELRGIAEGAGRTLGEILALNARGEMVYAQFLVPDGCSSFALMSEGSASGHTFAGQNWDWRIGAAASRIILRIEQPPKPTITMLVEAGQIGRHGVNSEGIGIFANGLPTKRTQIGVPQTAIRRKILDQTRFDRALEIALDAPGQIPANLVLAHRDFAIDVESTPGESRWKYPKEGILTHANHYEYFKGEDFARGSLGADSIYRSYLLKQGLSRARGLEQPREVLEVIAASLSSTFSHPNGISVHPDPALPEHLRWATLCSTIVDFTEGSWYMADGAPDERPYRRLPWNLFERKI